MIENNPDSKEYNRRDVLKTTGTASIATTLGIAGLSGQVSAADRRALNDIDLEEITGSKAEAVIDDLKETREWNELHRKVKSEGWNLNLEDTIVHSASARGNQRILASIGVESESETDYFRLIIGKDKHSDEIIKATLERRMLTGEGAKIETFRSATGIEAGQTLNEDGATGLTKEVLEISNTASGVQVTQNGDVVRPNGLWCLACKAVVKTACRVGCASGAGFICGLASVATNIVGGSACLTIASKVCWALAHTTSCGLDDAEICCEAGDWCCTTGWD